MVVAILRNAEYISSTVSSTFSSTFGSTSGIRF